MPRSWDPGAHPVVALCRSDVADAAVLVVMVVPVTNLKAHSRAASRLSNFGDRGDNFSDAGVDARVAEGKTFPVCARVPSGRRGCAWGNRLSSFHQASKFRKAFWPTYESLLA